MALITLTAGDDLFDGYEYGEGSAVEVNGAAGKDTMFGSLGDDTIYGDKGDDRLLGGAGADLIYGGAGNDTIFVTSGADTVWGGSGNDLVTVATQDFDVGGVYLQGGNGNDTLNFYFGFETPSIKVGPSDHGLFITLNGATMEAIGFERLEMTAAQLDFTGGDEVDAISIFGGASQVALGGGDDSLSVRVQSAGGSTFDGGLGRDTLTLDLSMSGTRVLGSSVALAGTITLGSDVTSFANFEEVTIIGTAYRDRVDFSASGVKLTFEGGESVGFDHDYIIGGSRGSWLSGGSGRDTITGGGNDDTITGGSGADKLTGGYGADVFIFERAVHSLSSGGDVIFDFASDDMAGAGFGDTLDLSQVRANAGLSALTFIGEAAFTAAGQVRAVDAIDGVLVQVNTQGTGTAEMVIKLAGLADAGMIQASDFLL